MKQMQEMRGKNGNTKAKANKKTEIAKKNKKNTLNETKSLSTKRIRPKLRT